MTSQGKYEVLVIGTTPLYGRDETNVRSPAEQPHEPPEPEPSSAGPSVDETLKFGHCRGPSWAVRIDHSAVVNILKRDEAGSITGIVCCDLVLLAHRRWNHSVGETVN